MNLDFLKDSSIDDVSRALAHLVFRNGIVEDIQAEGKLSQEDMKKLNKDVQNRIAGLIGMLHDGKLEQLKALIAFASLYGKSEWDECEPYSLDKY